MRLVEEDQGDVEDFNLLGFRNRWGTDNLCSTTGKVTSPAEMLFDVYRSVVPWDRDHQLSGRAIFSAPTHLIGDLRSTMLAYKVEHVMFIRLNRHLVDEVRKLDAAVE